MQNVGLLTAFAAGLLSFLSPCVAPLLPGYLALIGGNAATVAGPNTGGVAGRGPVLSLSVAQRLRLFWPSLVFVLGFTLVFVSLGTSAAVFGDTLAQWRGPMTRIAGALMIVMGFVIIWGSHLPFFARERRFHKERRTFTISETLLLGMAFGFGWTPCIGPILASILVYTSTAETVREGTLLLTIYSLGLGLPFLMAGLGLGVVQRFTRMLQRHGNVVVLISGISLILIGLLFVSGQVYRLNIAGEQLLGATRTVTLTL